MSDELCDSKNTLMRQFCILSPIFIRGLSKKKLGKASNIHWLIMVDRQFHVIYTRISRYLPFWDTSRSGFTENEGSAAYMLWLHQRQGFEATVTCYGDHKWGSNEPQKMWCLVPNNVRFFLGGRGGFLGVFWGGSFMPNPDPRKCQNVTCLLPLGSGWNYVIFWCGSGF